MAWKKFDRKNCIKYCGTFGKRGTYIFHENDVPGYKRLRNAEYIYDPVKDGITRLYDGFKKKEAEERFIEECCVYKFLREREANARYCGMYEVADEIAHFLRSWDDVNNYYAEHEDDDFYTREELR